MLFVFGNRAPSLDNIVLVKFSNTTLLQRKCIHGNKRFTNVNIQIMLYTYKTTLYNEFAQIVIICGPRKVVYWLYRESFFV